ncbi:hypothetical protein [Rothia koreensis]|uniref:hypothetical protein n=1 Tax=Rothia koreensis TaxID=592378 RepID=UPI003FCD23C0
MTRKNDWCASAMPGIRDRCIRDNDKQANLMEPRVQKILANTMYPEADKRKYEDYARGVIEEWRSEAEGLKEASLYWVSDDMAQLALEASRTMPLFQPHLDLPSDFGLMCFEKPLPPVEAADTRSPQAPKLRDNNGAIISKVPVDAVLWDRVGDKLDIRVKTKSNRLRLHIAPGFVPLFHECTGADVPFENIDLTTIEECTWLNNRAHFLALMGAIWHLMALPSVSVVREIDSRNGKPVASSSTAKGRSVALINMKPPRQVKTETQSGKRSWKLEHRVYVSGHWRRVAHGKDRALRRQRFVEPYVKGPEGAPLKKRERVNGLFAVEGVGG